MNGVGERRKKQQQTALKKKNTKQQRQDRKKNQRLDKANDKRAHIDKGKKYRNKAYTQQDRQHDIVPRLLICFVVWSLVLFFFVAHSFVQSFSI